MPECLIRSCGTTSREVPTPPEPDTPATVLFSGGSDSTLTASLYAEKGFRVHLLTYGHRVMRFTDKCLKSLRLLQDRHGADRFQHHFLDLNPIMDRLYFRELAKDLRRYGTYALPMCCGSCKLAMHVRTILYNRQNGIGFAADGSNVELSELFPEQMPAVLALYADLYSRFDIRYATPVFDVRRTDHVLYERGVTKRRNYKHQVIVYSNQHSCFAGTLLHAYTLGLSVPLFGRSADQAAAAGYVAAKIREFCLPYLQQETASCPVAGCKSSG